MAPFRAPLSLIHSFNDMLFFFLARTPASRHDSTHVPSETLQERGRVQSGQAQLTSPRSALRGDLQMPRGRVRDDGKRIPTYHTVYRPLVTASAPHDPPTRFSTASRPTGASGERRSRRRWGSDSDSDLSRAWVGAGRPHPPCGHVPPVTGQSRQMSPGGGNVSSTMTTS